MTTNAELVKMTATYLRQQLVTAIMNADSIFKAGKFRVIPSSGFVLKYGDVTECYTQVSPVLVSDYDLCSLLISTVGELIDSMETSIPIVGLELDILGSVCLDMPCEVVSPRAGNKEQKALEDLLGASILIGFDTGKLSIDFKVLFEESPSDELIALIESSMIRAIAGNLFMFNTRLVPGTYRMVKPGEIEFSSNGGWLKLESQMHEKTMMNQRFRSDWPFVGGRLEAEMQQVLINCVDFHRNNTIEGVEFTIGFEGPGRRGPMISTKLLIKGAKA